MSKSYLSKSLTVQTFNCPSVQKWKFPKVNLPKSWIVQKLKHPTIKLSNPMAESVQKLEKTFKVERKCFGAQFSSISNTVQQTDMHLRPRSAVAPAHNMNKRSVIRLLAALSPLAPPKRTQQLHYEQLSVWQVVRACKIMKKVTPLTLLAT